MRTLALLLTLCAAALAQSAPRIVSFRAEPPTIKIGASATLSWQVEGADLIRISGIGVVASSGSIAVSPASTTRYTLSAFNSSAEVFATVTVSVEYTLPRIISFRASPTTVIQGRASVLSWEVADAAAIRIDPLAPGTTVDFSPEAGSLPVFPSQTTTYVLTAVNRFGLVTAAVTVSYSAGAPDVQTVTPATLHFLEAPVGTTKTRTAALESIPFYTDVRLSIAPEGSPFKLESPATTYSSATIKVSFSPKQSGVYEATLRIAWAPSKITTIRLYGAGVDATAPAIIGIANSADSTEFISGDSYFAIYGQELSRTTRSWSDADFLNARAPTALDGVSVEVNGKPAFISYVSPSQINILTPPDPAPPETATLIITTGNRKTNAVRVATSSALSFISWQREHQNYVAVIREDGTSAGPAGLLGPSVALTPANAGERVRLYLTGLAPEPNPELQDGQLGNVPVSGMIPAITLTAKDNPSRKWTTQSTYAYRTQPGLYQVGFRIPDAPPGEYIIRCDYNGANTVADYILVIGPK